MARVRDDRVGLRWRKPSGDDLADTSLADVRPVKHEDRTRRYPKPLRRHDDHHAGCGFGNSTDDLYSTDPARNDRFGSLRNGIQRLDLRIDYVKDDLRCWAGLIQPRHPPGNVLTGQMAQNLLEERVIVPGLRPSSTRRCKHQRNSVDTWSNACAYSLREPGLPKNRSRLCIAHSGLPKAT